MKTLTVLFVLTFIALPSNMKPAPLWSRFGEIVIINKPVDGDVYISGGTVTIDAAIGGDLVVAGGTVILNDTVRMDVLVAGGNVVLNGFVGDDVRCASGSLTVEGTITGDILGATGELLFPKNGVIKGNLVVSGGKLTIGGDIEGDLQVSAAELYFDGNVEGSLKARGERIVASGHVKKGSSLAGKTITIDSMARFEGDINFWSPSGTLDLAAETHKGDVVFDPSLEIETPRWELLGFASLLIMLWYLGTALVMIWLIEYLFSTTFLRAADSALNESMKSIGYGLTFLLGVPIICIVLAITVLAIPIAVILIIGYVILAFLATAITAIIISNWINKVYYKSEWSITRIVFVAFGVFVVLKLATLTPVIGPLMMGIMACMAFGAILITVKRRKVAVP